MPARRTVTVLFCDVVGSTALAEQVDAEAVWPIMSSYFETMRPIIERHGGVVEKFIGDAIMAVFGLEAAREDDALRAVRAAHEMREALATLNEQLLAERGVEIANRIGINTGEVLIPEGGANALATGDAVNVAARLEQAAGPTEVLLGETTFRLVEHAVEAERLEGIPAKGKSEPLQAVRLISLRHGATTRPATGAQLVGREAELVTLRQTWRHVLDHASPRLVTIMGTAGVGKSRLVSEFVNGLADRATVLRGRCLSYGDGLTYWPIREIVYAIAGVTDVDTAKDVAAKLGAIAAQETDGAAIAAIVGSAVGAGGAASADEIAWAIRRLLELLATDRPLIVIIEDLHWAQPTLLDLLDHVRDEGAGPLLLLCPARPEFEDLRPSWLSHDRVTTMRLETLSPSAADEIVDAVTAGRALSSRMRQRVVAAAEGNPLFLEELARLMLDRGESGVDDELPPTIQAVMAARIDQLEPGERSVAQRASVIGRVFEEPQITALTPESHQAAVDAQLQSLVRREILTVEQAVEAAFKFRHILIRDAAYRALPKSERADLHEAFADWLTSTAGDRSAEYDELIGFHLADAHRYLIELRQQSPRVEAVGVRAADHLSSAGRAAFYRGDAPAAAVLFERSAALPQQSDAARARLLVRWADALQAGGQYDAAFERAEAALAMAREAGDRGAAALAKLTRLEALELRGGIVNPSVEFAKGIDDALDDALAAQDPLATARALQARSLNIYLEGRLDESQQDIRDALDAARQAKEERLIVELEMGLLVGDLVGAAPAGEVATHARAVVAHTQDALNTRSDAMRILSIAEAMLQMADESRRTVAEGLRLQEQLRRPIDLSICLSDASWVERINGDLEAAESYLLQALALAPETDQQSHNLLGSRMVVVLVAQDRLEDAESLIAEIGETPQMASRARLLGATARIHALRGDERARDEVAALLEMAKATSFVNVRTDILIDAAEAMAGLGDVAAARTHFDEAIALSDAKEHRALAAQLRERVAQLLAG